jgi:pimeloyl-ACP methyl ester carboxylesterase
MPIRPPSDRPRGQPERPSALLLFSEPWRSAIELGALTVSAPGLARAPRGDGHPVLVLPGLLASDTSTLILRRFLGGLGYATSGWGFGVNVGPTNEVVRRLPLRLGELANRYEQPVSIIGWSLGGVYARALAARSPDLVRLVVTLGSPYATQGPGHTHADTAYRFLSRGRYAAAAGERRGAGLPLSVPTTSVYSRLDGIVSWRVCRDAVGGPHESIGIPASHLGFGHNPAALWVIADRLAQDPDHWRPFTPSRQLRRIFTADQQA